MKINLTGEIVDDGFAALLRMCDMQDLMPHFCAKDLRDALRDLPAGDTLTLTVNSGGGQVFAGFEMFSILQESDTPVTVHVQSLAGSAASVMLAGATRVTCSPAAQVMIHLPSCESGGDALSHRQMARILDSVTTSIVNAYASKCGDKADRATLQALVDAETWMPAQEALALGLVDEIVGAGGAPIDTHLLTNGAHALPMSAMREQIMTAVQRIIADATQEPTPVPPEPAVVPDDNTDFYTNARARIAMARNGQGAKQ